MKTTTCTLGTLCIAVLITLASSGPVSGQICRTFTSINGWIGTDTLECDTLRIGQSCPSEFSIEGLQEGDSIQVPIYLWTDEPVSGFALGFTHDNDNIEITSFGTSGTPLDGRFLITNFQPALNQAVLGYADISGVNPLPPTDGSSAQLAFRVNIRLLAGFDFQNGETSSLDTSSVGNAKMEISLNHGGTVHAILPIVPDCGECDIGIGRPCGGIVTCGDFNGDESIDIIDAVYMVNYIFAGGPAPMDSAGGDVNCDGKTNITDIVIIINYLFDGGPAPCAGCP